MFIPIDNFPTYQIDENGRIMNTTNLTFLNTSIVTGNIVRVNLWWEGRQHSRSLAKLVAEHFVYGKNDVFNTPIHLDGDKLNCSAPNLMWRPRWFAWHYTHQFETLEHPSSKHAFGPVVRDEDGVFYETIYDAAVACGLLFEDIYKSVKLGTGVFPHGYSFRSM